MHTRPHACASRGLSFAENARTETTPSQVALLAYFSTDLVRASGFRRTLNKVFENNEGFTYVALTSIITSMVYDSFTLKINYDYVMTGFGKYDVFDVRVNI